MDADQKEILRSLEILFQPGDTVELRCVGGRTINGFYRDFGKLAQDAYSLNQEFGPPQNVYLCLNPVLPELYARRPDEFGYTAKGEGVRDQDIVYRRWLLIDIDPVRPSGISATDEQKRAAIELATQVYRWLQEQLDSECIVCADSGNGAHMLILLPSQPADAESAWVCQRLLHRLSEKFSNAQAKVDTTTGNAARICTLYGTVKRKGSDIPEQPHRLSKIVHVPDPLRPVDWTCLAALVEPYPGDQPARQSATQSTAGGNGWDIDQLLVQRQIAYTRDDDYRTASGETAKRWELEVCPWNSEHSDRSAWIVQWNSGAVAAGCHHDGCSGKDWQELKEVWGLPASGGITAADIILPGQQQIVQQPMVLAVTPAHTIEPQLVEWLWPGRIALGKLTIIAGRGGTGKTFLICDLASRVSAGLSAPDGQQLRSGHVLLATGEDGLADTLVPRLITHEANLQRVDFIEGVRAGDQLHLLDLLRHLDYLRSALVERPDAKLLIVDPISSFMGEGIDTHKTSDVRRVLSAVARLAEDHAIAFVGIHHLRKTAGPAIHAITGSQAFSDAVRTVWLIGADKDNPRRRLMLPSKNNLADMHGSGLAYTIEMGRVLWEQGPVLLEADELLQEDNDLTPRDEAKAWLRGRLEHGEPQPAKELLKTAAADGIANKTLRRAKTELGVISKQRDRAWVWQWPDPPSDDQEVSSDTPNP